MGPRPFGATLCTATQLKKLAEWLTVIVHQEVRSSVQIGYRDGIDIDSDVPLERRENLLNMHRPIDGLGASAVGFANDATALDPATCQQNGLRGGASGLGLRGSSHRCGSSCLATLDLCLLLRQDIDPAEGLELCAVRLVGCAQAGSPLLRREMSSSSGPSICAGTARAKVDRSKRSWLRRRQSGDRRFLPRFDSRQRGHRRKAFRSRQVRA